MVVVRRVRNIATGILRSATDAIRWGTLHGIVQALHRWSAQHRQRLPQPQPQQQRWRQLRTIGWQSLADPLRRRPGMWIVPQLLTFAEIGKSSYGTLSTPKEMSRKFTNLLEGSQARPSDMETCDWGFGCQETAEIMRFLGEMSSISKEHTTRCHNRGWWIGGCGLCLSMAMGSRYTTKRRETVLEVEEVLGAWHARLEGYSDWMWSGWMWRLQERGIEREDNCLGGASGKRYVWFLWSLALRSWYRPGGVWGLIWVRSSRGLV